MDAGDWYLEVNGRKVGPFTLDQIQGFLDDGEIRAYHQVTSQELGGKWISVEELLTSVAPPAAPSELPPLPNPGAFEIPPVLDISDISASAGEPGPSREVTPAPTHYVAAAPAPAIPTVYDGGFQPPPRPEIQANAPIEDKTDPAHSLFNALQILRERRVASIQPPSVKTSGPRKPLFKVPTVKLPDISALPDVKQIWADIRARIPAQFTTRMILTGVFAGIVLGSLTWGFVKALRSKAHPSAGTLTQVSNGRELPKLEPQSVKPFMRPTEPQRFIPPPPPAAVHVAPVTRPNFQNPEPQNQVPQQENYPPQDQANPYPPQEQNYAPSAQQPEPQYAPQPDPMTNGNAVNGDVFNGANGQPVQAGDPNNPAPPPPPPADAPGQDAFPPPPTQ